MKKGILITLLILLLGGGGYLGYKFYIQKGANQEALALVPSDAVFIIETDNPVEAWKTFSKSPMWNHVKKYKPLGDVGKMTDELSKTVEDNDLIFSAFGKRNVFISAHVVSKTDYDFLYVCDMQNSAKFDVVKSGIISLMKNNGYTHTDEKIGEDLLNKFYDPKDRSTLHMAFAGNQLVVSYNYGIIKNSLENKLKPYFTKDLDFTEVQSETAGGGLCKFYLNYAQLPNYLSVYMDDVTSLKPLFNSMHYTGATADMTEDMATFSGYTNIDDSTNSHLRALAKSGKSKTSFQKVLSNKAAFVMSMGFKSFGSFFENLKEVLKEDNASWIEFESNKKLTERFLGISVEDDFLGWIDDEVAVAHYEQNRVIGGKVHNVIAIKAQSIDKAKEKLEKVERKIKNRIPGLKFKTSKYKEDYDIHFMEAKGLFKLLFGKMFGKMDKPYFTFIGDHVVFSDDITTLLNTVDDYEAGRTLDKDEAFNNFFKQFNNENTVMTYLNTKKYFLNFKAFMNPESFKESYNHREFIVCFSQMGFALSENSGKFDTRLFVEFNKPDKEDMEITENKALDIDDIAEADSFSDADMFILEFISGKMKTEYYDNEQIKFKAEMDGTTLNGAYIEYWENGKVKIKGKYKNGKKTGKWKYFNEDGEFDHKEKFGRKKDEVVLDSLVE